MQKSMTVLLMIARLLAVVQIVVGLCLWFGVLKNAVAFHSAAGSLFVLVAWIIAGIALFALPARGLPLFTLFLAGVVLWFGMAQVTILPGARHFGIQLLHLLLGLATLGLLEALGKAVKRHMAAQAAQAA